MSGRLSDTISLLDSEVARPLLLRSTSAKKTPICTCGRPIHGRTPIEIVPSQLFSAKTDAFNSFADRLSELVAGKLCTETPTSLYNTDSKFDNWWAPLFSANHGLTGFVHMWKAMIQFEHIFNQPPNKPRAIGICCGGTCDQQECACHGIEFRVGTKLCPPPVGVSAMVSRDPDWKLWAPCSAMFALQVLLGWAKLNWDKNWSSHEPSTSKYVSNLNAASFAVLENWFDMMTFNKLGPLATNSVQIEPEAPSFAEESDLLGTSSEPPRNESETVLLKAEWNTELDSSTTAQTPHLTIILQLDQRPSNLSPDWAKLADAWELAVEQRANSAHCMKVGWETIKDGDVNSLADQVVQFWRNIACPVLE